MQLQMVCGLILHMSLRLIQFTQKHSQGNCCISWDPTIQVVSFYSISASYTSELKIVTSLFCVMCFCSATSLAPKFLSVPHFSTQNLQVSLAAVDIIPLFHGSAPDLKISEEDLLISCPSSSPEVKVIEGRSGVVIQHVPTGFVVQSLGNELSIPLFVRVDLPTQICLPMVSAIWF